MRKTFAMLAVATTLNGCGEGSLEKSIREHMNDPAAAQFQDKITYKKYACISVNGKNGFGGYVGFKRFKMRNIGGDGQDFWLTDTEDKPCTKETLVHDSEMDEADEKAATLAEAQVMNVMKQAKLMPVSAKGSAEIPNQQCAKAAEHTLTVARMSVAKRYADMNAALKQELGKRLEGFKNGSCTPPTGYSNDGY